MQSEKGEAFGKRLSTLPNDPGVYRFIDRDGEVLYVGKAKNLRNRVRSYFRPSGKGDGRAFFEDIVSKTVNMDVIVTDTEKEALILESNLIRKHMPRYNVFLRDDKSFLSVRLTMGETFPRIHPVRRIRRDGARYFGPFASASALRETLSLIRARFPLRTCSPSFFANRSRPCLRFEIRQCTGPCCDRISKERYKGVVREAILFLEGKLPELLKNLRKSMKREAETLNFEEAARLRDAALAVEKTLEKQHVVAHDLEDRDAFALYREGDDLAIAVLFVREGRVVGSNAQTHPGATGDEDALSGAIMQYYSGERRPPPTILVPMVLPDASMLEEVLSESRGEGLVRIITPRRGPKRALLAMAGKNAAYALTHSDRASKRRARALEDLRERLSLPTLPMRIECFDASHIAGSWAVGAMAVFEGGGPAPKQYRTYKIRTEGAEDDFTMMGELILRRFAPGKEKSPDLLVVDGGPGQLGVALDALRERGLTGLPVAGLAKERGTGRDKKPERLHLPGRGEPLILPERSGALHLLQALRDEAHRFALKYHRKLRKARTLKTGLEEIPGVGPKRRAAILKRFGSLKALREADEDEIRSLPGIPAATAQAVIDFLREE